MNIRIIKDQPHSPAFNMAADMHLLETINDTETLALRFYEWKIPTISLGYMQKAAEVLDLGAMKRDGISWIRRPTGGRAILHWNDLTYSTAFSVKNKTMGSTVSETYKIISDCLITGLNLAGINARPHDSKLDTGLVRSEQKLPCFLAPNRDEIMVNEKKLVGSAQKRTATAVLQHGSIPISDDYAKLPRYATVSPERRETEEHLLRSKCSCISAILPFITINSLINHFAAGFIQTLKVQPLCSNWTANELNAIQKIMAKGVG
jgi:lipoyl(octanoyl) transferase